jgi:DNA-binding NarL/FixJ family response regulator
VKHAVNIMLLDDQPLFRKAMRALIEKKNCGFVVGEFNDLASARVAVEVKCPTLLILDLSVPDCEGPASIAKLGERWPQLKILVLTAHPESVFAGACLRAKAKGYVMKREPAETIITAIRDLLAGKVWVSEQVKSEILLGLTVRDDKPTNPMDALSDREKAVFRMLGQGLSSPVMAKKLAISVKTVEAHLTNMKKKLRQTSTRQVLRLAVVWMDHQALNTFPRM